MHLLQADAIVVGSGGAGTYAALRLKQLGLDPLLVTKGFVGKSGCSIFAGNLALAGRMLGGGDAQAKDLLEYFTAWWNNFLIDQEYLVKCGTWLEKTYYPELDEAGLYFRRDDQGQIVRNIGRLSAVIAANQQGQSGMLYMDRRRKQLRQESVRTLEETVVTALLTNEEGRVIGVTGLHYPTGETYAVAAKAVILATGHSDRLATRSTGTREQSADGIALAYRVGAELANIEIQWWHTSDFAFPKIWDRMHVYPNPLLGTTETARMYNSDGEQFFEQKTDTPVAPAPYATQFKRFGQQMLNGKARMDGAFYTSYSHIPKEPIKEYNYHAKAFEKLGIDISKDHIETAPSWHCRQGGVFVNPHTMETTVPGLYVAGGLGSHSNGGLGVVTYDGGVAAETIATRFVRSQPIPTLPSEQVSHEAERLEGFVRPFGAGDQTPAQLKTTLRALMATEMGFVKTESGMRTALEEIRRLREQSERHMGLKNLTRQYNYGWVDAIDLQNMLDVCELTILSALNRKESRGPFYRPEYPYTDNAEWHAKNILLRDANGRVSFRKEIYETPYLKPGFERMDYFAVPW